jgi:hypothetical protein
MGPRLALLLLALTFALDSSAALDTCRLGSEPVAFAGHAFPLDSPPDAAPSRVSRGLQQAWAKMMSGDRSGARRLARKLAEEHPADASVRASLAMFSSPG